GEVYVAILGVEAGVIGIVEIVRVGARGDQIFKPAGGGNPVREELVSRRDNADVHSLRIPAHDRIVDEVVVLGHRIQQPVLVCADRGRRDTGGDDAHGIGTVPVVVIDHAAGIARIDLQVGANIVDTVHRTRP